MYNRQALEEIFAGEEAPMVEGPLFSTKAAEPEQGRNGKWCAAFENYVTRGGETYMSSTCSSAPLFDTAADAEEAGKRALAVLEATGKYPNMCEKF